MSRLTRERRENRRQTGFKKNVLLLCREVSADLDEAVWRLLSRLSLQKQRHAIRYSLFARARDAQQRSAQPSPLAVVKKEDRTRKRECSGMWRAEKQ
jgi:hypothetical protein